MQLVATATYKTCSV